MAKTALFGRRPGFLAIAAAAAVAVALLVIPISYQTTTAHDLSLTLVGNSIDTEAVKGIAGELKEALDAEGVQLLVAGDDGAMTYTLAAKVAADQGGRARAVARAFERELAARGYDVRASVTPVRETVSGNVYAMMMDNVIRIEAAGKSDPEIEAEIVAALNAAGVPNAQVDVTTSADGTQREIRVVAEGGPEMTGDEPEIVLTVNGEEPAGEIARADCKIMLRESADGAREMVVEYASEAGVTATATVPNPESLNDQELADAILRQLAAGGATGISVSAEDGRVTVLEMNGTGVMGTAEEPRSWGSIKKELGTGN